MSNSAAVNFKSEKDVKQESLLRDTASVNPKEEQMTADEMRDAVLENRICSFIGRILTKHYPGYTWYVYCKMFTGVASVKLLDVHGDYGFVIDLEQLVEDDNIPMRAGGELLERCNLPRGPRPSWAVPERDFKGNAIGEMKLDTSGAETK